MRSTDVVILNGDPWFVAKDACDVLGIKEKSRGHAIGRLDQDQRFLCQIQKGTPFYRVISVIKT
ncbi:hypothetical protein GHC20_01075 [Brucella sp. 2280]|nr:hypothetical protein GHC20_01075 [Brucella sp. 2280]